MTENYWTRVARQRYARRSVLKRGGIAGAGVAGLALVGCGDDDDADPTSPSGQPTSGPTTAGQPKQGGEYRWAWQGTPHLDVHQDSISGARLIITAAYNRVFRYQDDAGLPDPDLASAMPEQPDETTFVIPIREGVQFHDKAPVNGRVLTAEDVAYSLNRARTDAASFIHKGDLTSVDTIEATDSKTVTITTKFPNAVLLTTLAGYQFIVLAEETVNEFGDLKTDRAAIGTGPYVVESASTDQGAILVRHPNYWRTGQPYFDRVQQFVIGDHWSQFLAGNLETVAFAPEVYEGADSFEAFLEDADIDGYTYESISEGSAQGHFMNNEAAPFNDLKVRQAINLICQRADNLAYGWPIGGYPSIALGHNHVVSGFGLPDSEYAEMPGFREDHERDIAEGLALLDQAGYNKDNPLVWEIMGWSVPNRAIGIDNLQVAAEMYNRESGGVLKPTVKGLEWGTWKTAEANHEFQMISSSYSMGVDPHEAVQKMFSSTGGRNFAQFRDAAFDEMLVKEQGTFDVDERKALVQAMLRYVNDPVRIPNVWTGTGPAVSVVVSKIQGYPALFDAGKVDQLYYA